MCKRRIHRRCLRDPDGLWIGESPLPMVIFYNKDLIEKDGLTILRHGKT